MNHPEREEWVPYLYGEAKPEDRQRLKEHLQSCSECRTEVDAWRQSLDCLDAWRLPRSRPRQEAFAPFLSWAVAAAGILLLGFGIGRLTAPKIDVQKVQALIEPRLREQLTQDFARLVHQELRQSSAATLAAANRQTDAAVAESAQVLYATFKRDLDTLAVNADLGLQRTEQQLVQLASDTQPLRIQNSSDHH